MDDFETALQKEQTPAIECGAVLLSLLFMTAGLPVVPAFAAQKTVQVDEPRANDPFLIARVTFDDADIPCGLRTMRNGRPEFGPVTPFDAGDDWLWHIAIHVPIERTSRLCKHSSNCGSRTSQMAHL